MKLSAAATAVLLGLGGCGSSGSSAGTAAQAGDAGSPSSGGQSSAGATSTGGSAGEGNGTGSAGASVGQSGAINGGGGAGGAELAPMFDQGFCVPKGPELAEVDGVEVIAEADSINEVQAIAMQGDTLYWMMQRHGIHRRAPGATQPELVVEYGFAWGLFVTETHVYWINNGERTLMRASLAVLPATPEEILPDVLETGLTVDAENIYFRRSGEGGIHKLPLAEAVPGGTATPTKLTENGGGPLHSAGGGLFYINNQAAYRVPVIGGIPEPIITLGALSEVLIAGDTLYAASDEHIYKRPYVAVPGELPLPLARGNRRSASSQFDLPVERLRLDGDRVYYREEHGALAWVKTDASDCRIIAHVPAPTGFENSAWEMDASHVYVIEDDVKLLSIPK